MKLQLARAQALLNQKRPKTDEAMKLLRPLVNRKNAPWPVYHYSGIAFMQKKEYQTALDFLHESIRQGSDQPETYHSVSICYFNLGQYREAEEYSKIALDKKPGFFKGWLHLGSLYRAQAKLEEALKCYHKANEINPKSAGVAYRIGEIYNDQGDLKKALELFDITVKIDSEYMNAYLAKSEILKKQRKYSEAEEALHEILKVEPKNLAARVSLAELYKYRGDYNKAVERYKRLLGEFPNVGGVRVNYALCMQELGHFDESEKNYLKAFEDQPGSFEPLSNYLMGLHYNPGRSKEEIFEAHKLWDQYFAPKERPERPVPRNRDKQKKLRIGMISGGFRAHPVGWMITKALENLPKNRFEVYCYTTNNRYDKITQRIHRATDKWQSVIGYNDEVIARMIRNDGIDILVELSGHAADTRLKTVALEPAPVIVKWVGGLFNTTGMQSVDYLITDKYESPEGEEGFYTEKLVRMPDDYICFMPPDYAPEVEELPANENGNVTFGCFNNPTKVNHTILEKWAEVMKRVPGSRLFLKSKQYDTEALKKRIIEKMQSFGIQCDRLIFEGQSPHDELLGCYNRIDIALDPWPYSGGLTTCEALWMGVPVVTKPGPTFAGRHSTTHLHNAGHPEWVAESWEEYIETAVSLAADPEKLAEIRKSLRKTVTASPLCDGRRFGAHLCKAFEAMWEQRTEGYKHEAPEGEWQDHITIEPLGQDQIRALTESKDAIEQVEEIEAEFIKQETKKAAGDVSLHQNGSTDSKQTSSGGQKETLPETFRMNTRDDVTICTPADVTMMTPYVLLEQEQWFENELAFVRNYLKPGMNIVDAGAGFGVYTLPAAKLTGKGGTVFSFEPGLEAKKYLEISKLENGFGNIEIIGKALSDSTGRKNWKTAETPELNNLDEEGEQTVQTVTLDAWWQFEGEPELDLIKLDLNGTEPDALSGAKNLLDKSSPLLLISTSGSGLNRELLLNTLAEVGYRLYEYIPGPDLLAEHDPQAGCDPYMQNLIAVKPEKAEELEKEGWFHDETYQPEEPEPGLWKNVLKEQPWTGIDLIYKWERQAEESQNREYLRALDYLVAAENTEKNNNSARSEKAVLLLCAAQTLLRIYNSGRTSPPVAMTLVRTLNALGKRGQAVEVMQQLAESTKLGMENMDPNLPFLMPLPEQDDIPVKTEFKKWLSVRTVEAWILLKDFSTCLSGPQELKLLNVLDGNPEANDEILRAAILHKRARGKESSESLRLLRDSNCINKQIFRQLCESTSTKKTSAGNGTERQEAKPVKLDAMMLITTDFPPYDGGRVGHSIRAYTLANFFARNGYKVYLIILQDLVKDREAPEMHENISILNFTHKHIQKESGQKIDLKKFCIYCVEKLKIETILSTSPPLASHFIARDIKIKYGNRVFWICDIRDIVSVHPVTRQKGEKENLQQKKIETGLMTLSDAVTTVASGMRKTILEIYDELQIPYDQKKFTLVENGYIEREEVPPQPEVAEAAEQAKKEGKIVLFYAGTGTVSGRKKFEKGNKDLTFLFEIFSKHPDLAKHFSLFIQGQVIKNDRYLENTTRGIDYRFFPSVPNKQMLANLKLADLGLNVNLDRTQAPGIIGGKLYDYIYCGLGLLLIYPDNAWSLFEFAGKHGNKPFFADISDENTILKTLWEIVENKENLETRKFKKEEIQQYNRYVQYQKMLDILDNRPSAEALPPSLEVTKKVTARNGREFTIAIPEGELFRLKNIFHDEEYKLPDSVELPGEPVILDIGANVGSFALYASMWSDRAAIHCFEPNPQVLPMLRKNIKPVNATVYPYALSDRDGVVELWQHPRSTGGASVTKSNGEGTLVEVPVRDTLAVLNSLGIEKVDILKIDTEGSEIDILNSLGDFLKNVHILLLEYHSEEDRRTIEEILGGFILYDKIIARKDLGTLKYINPAFSKRSLA